MALGALRADPDFFRRLATQALHRSGVATLSTKPNFPHATAVEFPQWHITGHQAFAIMEKELSRHLFLIGDTYSDVDICFYGYVHISREGGFEIERFADRRGLARASDKSTQAHFTFLALLVV